MKTHIFESRFQDIQRSLKARGDTIDLNKLAELNDARKRLQKSGDEKKAKLNQLSKEVGACFKSGDTGQAENLKGETVELKQAIQNIEDEHATVKHELDDALLYIPNILHPSVPEGTSEAQNKVVATVGDVPDMPWAKSHDQLGEALGILNFERASKISGSRFSFLLGLGARLERALVNFMLDLHRAHGYQEISAPVLIHDRAMIGAGQLPKFADDAFVTQGTQHYLSPTAEVPVTNYFADEVLALNDLPQKFVCYSPCFRKEAGSYGKDTKGLIRQHQFHKVELVQFVRPDVSYEALESLKDHAANILDVLELPYQVVELCTGDMGFGAAKTYDLEVWLPSQNTYREISSCSNCEDFQAQRANIKFKDPTSKKNQFVHTLNGSGLAIGRTLLAVLENYQQEDGHIKVPKALQPYMGCEVI